MDISQAIRTGVYGALDGVIMYGGSPVNIYDKFAPQDAQKLPAFIILGSQDDSERSVKGRRPNDATLVVDVVTRFLGPEGSEAAEGIMEDVNDIINPDSRADLDITANGWDIGDTTRINSTILTGRAQAWYIYRKITTYSFIAKKT